MTVERERHYFKIGVNKLNKPVSKEINGKTWYARRFTLGGANELKRSALQCMLGDSALSQAELRAMSTPKDGESEITANDIGAAAQAHFKMPMVSVLMQQAVTLSLRLRHSICTADGILIYRSVDDLEAKLDAETAGKLGELVDLANPILPVAAELEDAEKN